MVTRPQISDDLVEFVQALHEDVTGTRASSFEQALATFHRMHHATEWPMAPTDPHAGAATGGGESGGLSVDPDERAVFKARLADGTLAVPDEEIAAFDFADGQLLQVVAYPIAEGTSDAEGTSAVDEEA